MSSGHQLQDNSDDSSTDFTGILGHALSFVSHTREHFVFVANHFEMHICNPPPNKSRKNAITSTHEQRIRPTSHLSGIQTQTEME